MSAVVVLTASDQRTALTVTAAIIFGVALALRNALPLSAFLVAATPFLVLSSSDINVGSVVLILCGYAVVAKSSKRPAWAIGAATAVLLNIPVLRFPDGSSSRELFGSVLGNVLLSAIPIGLARSQRGHREAATMFKAQHAELQRLRSAEIDRALTDERTRIARDLHDIVAHHVSAISLRSSGALRALPAPAQQTPVADSLRFIGSSSAEALTAMRAMVGALRTASDGGAPLVPQPLLSDVSLLAAHTRQLGIETNVSVAGETATLSPALQMCAYRVVQEALTNVVKHGGASQIDLDIKVVDQRLDVTVRNDGGPNTRPVGVGHGINGMQERASLLGGFLTAGPTSLGGWQVACTLPVSIEATRCG